TPDMRLLKIIPDDTNIGFVRIRHIAFGVTALLTVIALSTVILNGLNFGVDFAGGVAIEEKFQAPPPLDEVRSTVDRLGLGEASLQQIGDPRTISIRLPVPKSNASDATDKLVEQVKTALAAKFPGASFSTYTTVSGKVSGELVQKGVIA